jgi:endonuclease/exonuclease/phosphatase family metal-dependent hydrolase
MTAPTKENDGRRVAVVAYRMTACIALVLAVFLRTAECRGDEPPKETAKAATVVAMTFNIRFNNPDDGPDAWPYRRDDVARLIVRERPDLLGMQEVLADQVADLAERLKDYDHHGVGRDNGKEKGEFSPIFYRRARFDVQGKGTFWLSETPDKIGSVGWDAALPRIATWLRVRDKASGKEFLVANVHFDHRGDNARVESARLLRRKLAELAGGLAVLLVGDFNAAPDSPPYKAVLESEPVDGKAPPDAGDGKVSGIVFRDARGLVDKPLGPNTTWNGFRRAVDDNRIDHVFVDRRWSAASYAILDEKTASGRFFSDHFPVVVKLRLEQ